MQLVRGAAELTAEDGLMGDWKWTTGVCVEERSGVDVVVGVVVVVVAAVVGVNPPFGKLESE